MFDELSKTIKAQLYERASSPLLSSFALSWIAWNYRFVVVIFSTIPVTDKIAYIDSNIFPSYVDVSLRGFLYPLLTALFLIFVYPYPAKYVYEYWRKRQRELKEIQQRIDDATPLTKEEARELRREAIKVTTEYEHELERRSTEIVRLKELLAEQERAKNVPKKKRQKKSETPDEQLDESQTRMLRKIANSKSLHGSLVENAVASSGVDKLLAEYNLGELERRELVSRNYSSALNGRAVKITHKGRTYLVNLQRENSPLSTDASVKT